MFSIMIVDDEEYILKAMQRILRSCEDFKIECFLSPEEALRRCQIAVFDVILSDYRMPVMNGVDFLSAARILQPESARMILSAHVDAEAIMNAINQAGISRFLVKPWNSEELIEAVYEAARKRKELQENRILSDILREEKALY